METLRKTFERTTEDAFIDALLSLSAQHARTNQAIASINNELSTKYNVLNIKRGYDSGTTTEYEKTLQDLLHLYNSRYIGLFEQAGLTDIPITQDSNSALYRFTAGNLFNSITNHKIREQTEASRTDKRRGKPLTINMIIEAAKLHKENIGKWPGSNNRHIIQDGPLAGEKWYNIDYCLRNGLRGLPKIDGGLPELLREYDCCSERKATSEDILQSMLNFRKDNHGEWPDQRTKGKIRDGTILDGQNWGALNAHTSLYQIRREYELTYTKHDVIASVMHYKNQNNGKRPNSKMPIKIDDGTKLEGYTWIQIDKMRIEGLTLYQIIKEYEAHPELYILQNTEQAPALTPHNQMDEEEPYELETGYDPQEFAFA